MASTKKTGNSFGLFGCEPAKEPDEYSNKRLKTEPELEEGEVVEFNVPSCKDNVQFDTLLSNFQQEESQKSAFKEKQHCIICSANPPKYTCPKCGMKTCSLNCCLAHKKEFSCNGVRDRLSFVPLKSYSEHNFQSDCKFLDEISEAVNTSSRLFPKNRFRKNQQKHH
ncbi:PREDICTED: box C/D snoRNA protein 1-like [Rhagoletis zephyria]|uniref:box C/D snoRNA protein 1-like n=1 Tax=Rhagoletis zephyria TaxID=28612 RepID=UPI0008114B46|nr:PREDICTED: box C/D snoRNA protein 1-like [Rhagoletis zephyria]